ncbi:Uncharacterised protein [Providencia rettgeri]|uniref:hypothetical protein n=1 Tax=Providencia rettgeri TaxID=587 RepID=UPI000D98BEB6|nr:Uncharacterised protein [Providencia rettgeri]
MQLYSSNEPSVSFDSSMTQEEAHAWIIERAKDLQKLDNLKARQLDLQRQLEALENDIYEQTVRCQVIISA